MSEGEAMKIGISAQGGDLDALVDQRFGRARWLIVYDIETDDWQAVDNQENVNASGGAGVQAGTTVANLGAGAVITGNVGPNAHRVLAAGGIVVHQVGGGVTVRDALAAFRRGELATVEAPTVSGH
jgi:predicted Fe-Mo cluster-binding NifX family protein